jgi:hypothetical protein
MGYMQNKNGLSAISRGGPNRFVIKNTTRAFPTWLEAGEGTADDDRGPEACCKPPCVHGQSITVSYLQHAWRPSRFRRKLSKYQLSSIHDHACIDQIIAHDYRLLPPISSGPGLIRLQGLSELAISTSQNGALHQGRVVL